MVPAPKPCHSPFPTRPYPTSRTTTPSHSHSLTSHIEIVGSNTRDFSGTKLNLSRLFFFFSFFFSLTGFLSPSDSRPCGHEHDDAPDTPSLFKGAVPVVVPDGEPNGPSTAESHGPVIGPSVECRRAGDQAPGSGRRRSKHANGGPVESRFLHSGGCMWLQP